MVDRGTDGRFSGEAVPPCGVKENFRKDQQDSVNVTFTSKRTT